jgi:3-hexulose-6-phosphate synthase/6-phospho-3-hexuloisomerase
MSHSQRPLLQLALDEANLAQALRVAREAVPAGVDLIEAGTPLIKSEGLATRCVRCGASFPGSASSPT